MHLPCSFKGVTVEVISEGEPLEFYDDPDEDPNDKRDLQRYIEAVTDAVFKVRVTLSTKFSLYSLGHDDAVRLSINYDGQPLDWYTDLSTKEIRRSWGSGQVAAHTFASVSRYCNDSQQWFRADTTFGALTTSDTAPSAAQSNDLGNIRVKIHRVYRTRRASPLYTSPDKVGKPVDEVSEKTLKGKAISNTVRTTNDVPSTGPTPTTYDITSMNGVEGEPLTLNILYRSRHNLQMLGCIPRSPSPEPETVVVISDDTSREQKVRELRVSHSSPAKLAQAKLTKEKAQLALLEGDGDLKAEGLGSRAKVKRELEDAEIAGPRKRSRNSGPVETVDLTGD